jgi:septal ring factor EnvC (AmiA/AmiB activator)
LLPLRGTAAAAEAAAAEAAEAEAEEAEAEEEEEEEEEEAEEEEDCLPVVSHPRLPSHDPSRLRTDCTMPLTSSRDGVLWPRRIMLATS